MNVVLQNCTLKETPVDDNLITGVRKLSKYCHELPDFNIWLTILKKTKSKTVHAEFKVFDNVDFLVAMLRKQKEELKKL